MIRVLLLHIYSGKASALPHTQSNILHISFETND